MCGVVAIFSPQRPVDREALAAATRALHHRGPDGQQTWVSADGRFGLGHARLSIIDLEGGTQPIANEDESLWVVVNGELYDHERLMTDLKHRGHQFRTSSDSEIALHLYEEYGPDCLRELRGEFAIILVDQRRGRIFAARDRFGIKPLYYAEHQGAVYFASEAKALFAAGVPASWSWEGFGQFLGLGVPHPDGTLFEGVKQVPPSHFLLLDANGSQTHRYWDFNFRVEDGASAATSEAEFIERFRDVLSEAVRLRLRADVPVGCYLSGGIDSCSVLGLAARQSATPPRAFTLKFDDEVYDEAHLAREMAARCGAEFVPIPLRHADLAPQFYETVWHSETLCLNAHGAAKFLLSKAVRAQGYKVVLTGEGADEILGGYPHIRQDMLLHARHDFNPAAVEQMIEALRRSNPASRGLLMSSEGMASSLQGVRQRLGFVPTWLESTPAFRLHAPSVLTGPYLDWFASRDAPLAFLDSLDVGGQLAGRHPAHQSLYLWARSVMPNYILNILGDRMEMANSIEGRVPFLDHHVVELLSTMPMTLKIRDLVEKYVLREAARDVLPEAIYRRQKHPFLAPPAIFRPEEPLFQMVADLLRSQTLQSIPFFDSKKISTFVDRVPQLDPALAGSADAMMMAAASACVLQERFRLGAGH